jgi:alkaline phosphatase
MNNASKGHCVTITPQGKQEIHIADNPRQTQLFFMNKKTRNRLLALGCLLVFLALGSFYYVNWVVQRPFAIILFLADNLTPSVLTPARNYAGGADHRLELEAFPHLALISTHANDFAISDAAAASTSIATGHKGNKGMLGIEINAQRLPTILDLATRAGRATGIVSNASLTDATTAAFYARTRDALDYPTLALELAETSTIDVILGGGAADFLPVSENGRRKDGRNLVRELRDDGFDVVRTESELLEIPTWRSPKTFGVFSMNNLNFADEFSSEPGQPSLATMVRKAIQLLQYNSRGYLLVVDAALAGKAASQNEAERTLQEILALDAAVTEAVKYAGLDTIIIVAGKRNVGGLRLNGHPFRNDNGAALLGTNAQGVPSFTWSTGPGSGTRSTPEGPATTEPVANQTAAGIETVEDAIVVGTGEGTERITGFMDNTELFEIVVKSL